MFRMDQKNELLIWSEKSPHYVCRALVEAMDNRKEDAKAETMCMYFEVDGLDELSAKDYAKSILRELGYSYCGIIGELIIYEYSPDMYELFAHGKYVTK